MSAPSLGDRLHIEPGTGVDLGSFDTGETFGHEKEAAPAELAADLLRLERAQEMLWAGKEHPVLIVLQGIDTAGKDGTIRHVVGAFNPQGCQVIPFGVPTPDELAHDYLWRIHRHTPARGHITIFNRSHYEDVLVVRVHGLVPDKVWRKRYDQINEFEELLAESGTTILKFFLAISKEEQRERLQARIDTPEKRWKFKLGDLDERKLWDDYQRAYEDALSRCSTKVAPWYLIPSDKKWFRNLAVARIVADAMDELDLRFPDPEPGIEDVRVT